MCLTCGCWEPDDDHGDPEYITLTKFARVARKDDLSVDEAAKNLVKTLKIAAKRNTGANKMS